MIETGVEIVLDHGLNNLAEHLTFKNAYANLSTRGIRLTNGSVIGRVFANQDQFHHQVLLTIASSQSEDFKIVAEKLFEDVLRNADRTTEASRWFAISELCRIGSRLMMDTLRESATWRTWIGIWALVGSSPPGSERDEITSALRESYRTLNNDTAQLFGAAIDFLGFQLKKPYVMSKVAAIVTSLSEGSSLREFVENPGFRRLRLPTGPDGTNQYWTPFGVGFFAMAKEFLEINPTWDGVGPQ